MAFYLRLAALALLLPAIPATAQVLFVTTDRTIANSNPIAGAPDSVVVGQNNIGTNFFGVDVDVTGNILGSLELRNDSTAITHAVNMVQVFAYNTSQVSISGGTVSNSIVLRDQSQLTFSSGAFNGISAFDSTTVSITGGNGGNSSIVSETTSLVNLSGNVTAGLAYSQGTSTMNISGGTFSNAGSQGNGAILNFGGSATATSMFADQFGHVNVTGGIVTKNFVAVANSTATITGGDFGSATTGPNNIYGIIASQNSVIDFGGSAVTRILEANANGVINVTGGTIGEIKVGAPNFAMTNSAINLYGGDISPNTIRAYGDGVLNVYGTNLALSGAIGSGTEASVNYIEYLLTGMLQNGQVLNTKYRDFAGGLSVGNPSLGTGNVRFFAPVAAPEPGTLVYLGVASVLGLVRRVRRQR